MARTNRVGYSGSLNLKKINGLRADKVTYQPVKIKPNKKLPVTQPARKSASTGRFK